jgi:hypothetical protein
VQGVQALGAADAVLIPALEGLREPLGERAPVAVEELGEVVRILEQTLEVAGLEAMEPDDPLVPARSLTRSWHLNLRTLHSPWGQAAA